MTDHYKRSRDYSNRTGGKKSPNSPTKPRANYLFYRSVGVEGWCIAHAGLLFGGAGCPANNNFTEITLHSDIIEDRVILWKYIFADDDISNLTIHKYHTLLWF